MKPIIVKPAKGVEVQSRVTGARGWIDAIDGDRVSLTWGVGDDEEKGTMTLSDLYDLTDPISGVVLVSQSGDRSFASVWADA